MGIKMGIETGVLDPSTFCKRECVVPVCRLCGGTIMTLHNKGVAVHGSDWCPDCGASVDLINFALDAKREVLNMDDLNHIKDLTIKVYGEFADKTTNVIIDGEDIGYLNKFIFDCIYAGYGTLVKYKGKLIDRDYIINCKTAKEVILKTIK